MCEIAKALGKAVLILVGIGVAFVVAAAYLVERPHPIWMYQQAK